MGLGQETAYGVHAAMGRSGGDRPEGPAGLGGTQPEGRRAEHHVEDGGPAAPLRFLRKRGLLYS